MPLRILTGGESHGPALTGIIEGLPAGLPIREEYLNRQLLRRQQGHGRGGRMEIESDKVSVKSGLRFGQTLGSPLTLEIINRDWENWAERMGVWAGSEKEPVTIPRPGHADLAGAIKYRQSDLRNILERASARETAMRTAVGAVCKTLLNIFGMEIIGHVISIGPIRTAHTFRELLGRDDASEALAEAARRAETSPVRCAVSETEEKMMQAIDRAKTEGDSLGGIFEIAALGVPAGLGSHVHWDRRLDAALAGLLMSIPGIKSVEIGLGAESGQRRGSEMHDAVLSTDRAHPARGSNNAGGIEGGISNGQPIVLRCAMKPIPTLAAPLPSIDMKNGRTVSAHRERSDICAVPAAQVVGEAMLAIGLASSLCEWLGHDSLEQMHFSWKHLTQSGR